MNQSMLIRILLLTLTTSVSLLLGQPVSSHVKYQWNYLNFTWPSQHAYEKALSDNAYIPKHNTISAIKIWKDRMYLSTPRFKNGVPTALVSLPVKSTNGKISPLLEPFPNWQMQQLDDCSAFQFVQSVEIDTKGRMWVLDNGRTEFITSNPKTKCPARLVILDLDNNNRMLLDYKFPEKVVNINSVFLNDIVLDHEDGGYAYIADSDTEFPGIIVFSLRSKTSWKVTDKSMKADQKAVKLVVNGTAFTIPIATDGIALSPASTEGNRVLYYSPLSSYNLFAVPVNQLKNNISLNVTKIGQKQSQSDGMFMSSTGNLYYSLLNQDAVAVWNTNLPLTNHVYFKDHVLNQWPDSFEIDSKGSLYWTSDRLQKLAIDQVNINEPNFRIFISKIIARSYQYYQDGRVPCFPSI